MLLVGGGWSLRVVGSGWVWLDRAVGVEGVSWRVERWCGSVTCGLGPVSGEGPAVGGVVEAEVDEAAEVDGGDAGG